MLKQFYCNVEGDLNGYVLSLNDKYVTFSVFDMGTQIEGISLNYEGEKIGSSSMKLSKNDMEIDRLIDENILLYKFVESLRPQLLWAPFDEHVAISARLGGVHNEDDAVKMVWVAERRRKIGEGMYKGNVDILPYYFEQIELQKKVNVHNRLPDEVKYVAGVDVAYNEDLKIMIGAIVVLDSKSLKVVDSAHAQMNITFPYIPGLFSFREIPPIIEAFKKLKIRPDLIVCDGQGIAHPKGVGMASHLGVELDLPTIGCAKKRLIGMYEKEELAMIRGSRQSLIWDGEEVGVALRTRSNVKPMFVSIGHKINLETSIQWVLKLCQKFRLPETTRIADQLVNKLMKERTEIDFFDDQKEQGKV